MGRVPRDSHLGICEGDRVYQRKNSGHTNQDLLLQWILLLSQQSGSRKVSCQDCHLGSCKLNRSDGLGGRTLRGALRVGRRGGRGIQGSQGLFLLPLVMGGSLSKSFRGCGECKDTRGVYQLLNCRANTNKKIGVRRGTLSSHCKESIRYGVGGQH